MGNEMAIKENLIRARSHIIFLVGLISAFGLVIGLESCQPNLQKNTMQKIEKTRKTQLAPAAMLTDQEKAWANTAWQYFENNYQPETGMVNSVDNYPASTMWDTSSYLMALIAARRLEIISNEKFDERISKLLTSLAKLELFDGKLPNKSYNTKTLEMVDYANNKSVRGIGWSAIDIGRLLVPFNILVWQYPQHTDAVKKITSTWNFNVLIKEGVMHGTALDKAGKTVYLQEGRLGYEQYAAKSLELLGLDVSNAVNYMSFLKYVDIYNIAVPTDSRDPDIFKAHNYVVSEPYILEGLEYGWSLTSDEFAYRVFAAQEQRYLRTGVLTAVSEDNLDQAPYFVYNTVFTDGKEWQTITDEGKDASKFRSISTKAAIGWHVLYNNDYTAKLMASVEKLNDPKKGWYSGQYEVDGKPNKSITANTNAIILESLCYKRFGPMVRQKN
jgi:Protein of unknown function (DUF3131)